MRDIKFSKKSKLEFSTILRSRVNDYFNKNQLSRYGNRSMIAKTILMLSLFFVPLVILGSGMVNSAYVLFSLYLVSGLGMTGIGMGVMHDANHGSYSKRPMVNRFLGYTMNLIGANSSVWKIQHNVLHHTYPNIEGFDEDINPPFFLRFSPNSKKHWIHQFQPFYIWFFYGLATLSRVITKDFKSLFLYHKLGFFGGKGELISNVIKIGGWKLLYFSYALVLPLLMIPLAPWIIILAFFSMHFLAGLLTSLVFQTAHIMPDNKFLVPEKDKSIEKDWYQYQMETTCNYSPRSNAFSWLIGGLNYQIEHHLLPNVCHVHYKNLAPIVSETAKEFGITYNMKKSFLAAITDHMKMIRMLGRG